MYINFRQGLVSFQKSSGTPTFLQASSTAGYVSFAVVNTATTATFAHGSSNYLAVFDTAVSNAWGPVSAGVTTYLYWDIDLLTANVTRGMTRYAPVVAATAPSAPSNDQHWFDTTTTTMKVWSTNKWLPKIRVFAGYVRNGNTSTITPYGTESQVALNVRVDAGYIMKDDLGQPLRTSTGEFLTTSSPVRVITTDSAGVLVKPASQASVARAAENIPAFSAVYFSGPDTIRAASSNPATVTTKAPVGIIISSLANGEVGTVIYSGEVSSDQFNWPTLGNLYVTQTGALTTTRPAGLLAYSVGFIKDPTTIVVQLDAETLPQVYTANTTSIVISAAAPLALTDTVNGIGERVVNITAPTASSGGSGFMSASQAALLTSLTTSKADITHTHVVGNVLGLQALIDGKSNTIHQHGTTDISGLQALLDAKAPTTHSHVVGDVTGLQALLDAKAALAHIHAIADTTGLQAALDAKAPAAHGHSIADVSNLQATLAAKADATHVHVIANVTGLAAALDAKADAAHVHTVASITGLQAELDAKANASHVHIIAEVTGLQTVLNNKTDVGHTHSVANVTGLQALVDGKIDFANSTVFTPTGQYNPATKKYVDDAVAAIVSGGGSITISTVTGLQAALDGKSPTVHAHAVSDVTGLQALLDGKAATAHTHTITDVTGLQAALDSKSATVHVHAIADVTGLQVALDSKSATVHVHAIADVTGLQAALDNKTALGHTHTIANVTGLQPALDLRLTTDNATVFTPTGQYNPATKKYVDDAVATVGTGGELTAANVTALTVIETSTVKTAKWIVKAQSVSTSTDLYSAEIFATTDGVSVANTTFAVLQLGNAISGLSFTVDISGGNLRLNVASTTAVNVKAKRVSSLT